MKYNNEKKVLTFISKNIDDQDNSKLHDMRSSATDVKDKRVVKSSKDECVLETFFRRIGLLYESENRVLFGLISFLFALPSITSFIGTFFLRNPDRMRLSLLHLTIYFLSTIIWFSMKKQSMHLTALMRSISNSQSFIYTGCQKTFFYLACSVPFIYAFADTVNLTMLKKTDYSLVYGFQINIYVGNLINCLKNVFHFVIYPTYTNLVSIQYCSLCLHVCRKLRLITADIEDCPAQEFTVSRQRDILWREAEIESLVYLIQKIFSVPTFFICTTHFCACIAMVGTFIADNWFYRKDCVEVFQIFTIFISSAVGPLACLWVAGGVPVEEERLKNIFRQKMKQRLLMISQREERYFQNQIVEKPTFVLSACEIIYFQRSSILSLAGTVLTYSVLLISKH